MDFLSLRNVYLETLLLPLEFAAKRMVLSGSTGTIVALSPSRTAEVTLMIENTVERQTAQCLFSYRARISETTQKRCPVIHGVN